MTEATTDRLKRLGMRSWRRGTKEMDMILGPFSDACLTKMSENDLALYDQLLSENDQDLYVWVTQPQTRPTEYETLLEQISQFVLSSRPSAVS